MTVVMKIDLAGPRRRGLALGLNEAAGYLGVAAAAFVNRRARRKLRAADGRLGRRGADRRSRPARSACSRARHRRARRARAAAHTVPARERTHVSRSAFAQASLRDPVLRACSQAGLVNNLNDALAWGLAPLYLAAHGASVARDRESSPPPTRSSGAPASCDRLALRPHRPQAADRQAACSSRRARSACSSPATAPSRPRCRRGAARRRHGDGLPDADRRRLGRQPAARPRARWSASTASGATSASSSAP